MRKIIGVFLVVGCVLFSCQKEINCPNNVPNLSITGDTAVNCGDTLHLAVANIPGVQYLWTGPFDSAYIGHVLNMPANYVSNSGTYQVGYFTTDGCVSKQANWKVNVHFKVPCQQADNTITYDGTVYNIDDPYLDFEELTCTDQLQMGFYFADILQTGVYHAYNGSTYPTHKNDVQVVLTDPNDKNKYYTANTGQPVYVNSTFSNDYVHVTLTFCNLTLNNGKVVSGCLKASQ